MILRRVIEHVRNQQWTAIAIDFAIVVIGVFVGIQVANWNEDRATQRKALQFTESLRADLVEENWGYQFLIAYNGEVLANAEKAVDALDGTAPLDDEALLVAAYRATQYKQRLRRRSTYDELVSTGTIGLIHDRALRDTAMRLYNIATIDVLVREGLESRYREAFRMSLPTRVQRALGKNCGDRYIRTGDLAAIHGILDYACETGLASTQIAAAAQALRSNPELVPLLRLRIADIDTRLVDMTGNNRELWENLQKVTLVKP